MRPETSAKASPEEIDAAATWLADNWHICPRPITRTLREMFGLGFVDSAKAMAETERRQQRSAASGQ